MTTPANDGCLLSGTFEQTKKAEVTQSLEKKIGISCFLGRPVEFDCFSGEIENILTLCQNGDNAVFCASNKGHGQAAISIYFEF